MTSGENVENKQDKCSESDNVHYDNLRVGSSEWVAKRMGEIWGKLPTLRALPGSSGKCITFYRYGPSAQSPANQPNPPNHHASPINPSQVNQTPLPGIVGE